MGFFSTRESTSEQYFRELDLRRSKLADQIYWLSTACCSINTKYHFSTRCSIFKHLWDCAFLVIRAKYIDYTIVAKKVVLHKFKYVLVLVLKKKKDKLKWWYHKGEGRGTYAHPFPLQQNEVSDFFGHESILTIWKQETSSKITSYFFQT